jgi:protein TonB
MNEEALEKKNKRTALLYTTGIQVVLFIALFFIIAWRAPDPPIPEYGIELNFGMDAEGFGEVQPKAPVGNKGKAEEQQPEENKPEVKEETPKVEEKVAVEPKPEEVKPAEPEVVSKVESPVVVKEKKVEEKPVEKPIEKPVVEKPKVEEKPKVDQDAVFKPKPGPTSGAESKTPTNKAGEPGNHGDDPGKVGDKGSPEGQLNKDALYGKAGGGSGGVSVFGFSGFKVPEIVVPQLPDGAFGSYEFVVKVDDQGDVIGVVPQKRGLSLEAERILKDYIQKLYFEPHGPNLPPMSEGKITVKVVSK